MLVTARTGGAGLNLCAGTHVIQCEPWFTIEAEVQAQSRCHRMGQTKEVYVRRIIGTNSMVDQVIRELQTRKRQTNTPIMDALRHEDDKPSEIPYIWKGSVGEM